MSGGSQRSARPGEDFSDPRRDYRWALVAMFVAWLAVPFAWQAVRVASFWLGIAPESRAASTP